MPSESTIWTVGQLLNWTARYLKEQGSESARLDAEVLLAHVRQCDRIMLYTAFDEPAPDSERAAFRELVRRRASGAPVAHLVGHKEFYSIRFRVTPDVLVPRVETEFLVVALLDLAQDMAGPLRIADVGAGSGVIAVCAARHLPDCQVTAIDASQAALRVTAGNAEAHAVADRVTLLHSDLLEGVPEEPTFDVIASNPPYVSEEEYEQLPPSVREFEPAAALVGGPTGLETTLRLIDQARPRLRSGGALVLETSPMLEPQLRQHLASAPQFSDVQVIQDLAGLARVVTARKLDAM
jgi:release factor glutamine methyltransferase